MQNNEKLIVVVDGMGAGIGKAIVDKIVSLETGAKIMAVGTNSAATANMLRAGVSGATGENACIYNCGKADVIVGPIGIILPNAMNGEISPAMALSITQSEAAKILLPVSNRHIMLAGVGGVSLAQALEDLPGLVRGVL